MSRKLPVSPKCTQNSMSSREGGRREGDVLCPAEEAEDERATKVRRVVESGGAESSQPERGREEAKKRQRRGMQSNRDIDDNIRGRERCNKK